MAALMFASFYLMGSTPLPVSGLIKQEKFNMGLGHFLPALLTWVLEHTNPVIKEIFAIVRAIRARETVSQPQAGLTTFLTGAIVIPWMLLEWRHYRSGRREGGVGWLQTIAPLGELYVVLMAVTLPHLVYISSFPQYMTWYRSPELLLSVLTMGLALHRIGWLARQSRAEELVSAHRAVAAAMVGTLALSGWSLGHDSLFVIEPKPNYRERVAIARWIDQHLAPETVVAAWSAGLLSYYSNRRVINLDGLANDTAFFREVLVDRSVSLPEYLQRNGVSLIIDHTIHDPRVLDHFVPVDISKNFARTRILQAPGFDLKPGLVQALLQTEHRTF